MCPLFCISLPLPPPGSPCFSQEGGSVCGVHKCAGSWGAEWQGTHGASAVADSLFSAMIPLPQPPLHTPPQRVVFCASPASHSRSPTEGLSPLGFCTLWPCDSTVAFLAPPPPRPLCLGRCEILIASLGTGLFLSVMSDQNIILSCQYNYGGGGDRGKGAAR